jgi:hypothetical protein
LIAGIVGLVDHKNGKQFDTAQGTTAGSPGESSTGEVDADVEAEIEAGENAQIV